MSLVVTNIFNTVPKKDYLGFHLKNTFDYKEIARFADLSKPDLSSMTEVKVERIRFDRQIPKAVRKRLEEIGNILNLVAAYFGGDKIKTTLWYSTKNPGLGNISPKEMIRLNRHNNLRNFILAAREEHDWGE